jgi:hypothetical protein
MATKKIASPRLKSISADEKRWRAQSDADTLARAEEIKADRSRLTAAQSHASKEAQRFSQVAKQKPAAKK